MGCPSLIPCALSLAALPDPLTAPLQSDAHGRLGNSTRAVGAAAYPIIVRRRSRTTKYVKNA
jgi:hypothetical protein